MKCFYYRIIASITLLGVGLLIWLSNLGVIDIRWRRDWPVILIIFGVIELIKHIIHKRA
jgi:hypothetical protein